MLDQSQYLLIGLGEHDFLVSCLVDDLAAEPWGIYKPKSGLAVDDTANDTRRDALLLLFVLTAAIGESARR